MLIQTKMISKVKEKCFQDNRVSACMTYGSFTKGEGDSFSDIEFYIFLKDGMVSAFNSMQWISDIYPVDLLLFNEYGTEVAIFTNMIRGEFHFLPACQMDIIKSFKPTGVFPDTESMFLYDSTGRLSPLLDHLSGPGPDRMTNENVNFAFNNFVNEWIMGINLIRRGELARSLEILSHVQKYILQLIRVKENSVVRWVNYTKNLEKDICEESYGDYVSITSALEAKELFDAYKSALQVMEKLYHTLGSFYKIEMSEVLIGKLYDYLYK
ncbi:nucleotidyltransferase [Sporosarcina sp. Te-1]|uniref:nucleotidyltransferase n=1 Tax=Sporosarcina sp. Te-1 TaxID=2818390 RepID=UPI001A9DE64F|nr:nucleotidyltransferase [Sporosarcina sp. Te-1]QTD41860.1 nucleotidyltransferase [Sporosarcina sp. Te-1]